MPEIFSPPDMDHARNLFGAMCGHGALAAAIGESVSITEHLFEKPGGWVNLPQMKKAIGLCPRLRILREENSFPPPDGDPEMRLVLLQFTGPWMREGVPAAARCRHRHWIASYGSWIWDANEPEWMHKGKWKLNLLPELLPEKGDGGFEVVRVLVLQNI